MEMRGRAASTSFNGGEPHGLERIVESLKIENGDIRRALREMDDRCTSFFFCTVWANARSL